MARYRYAVLVAAALAVTGTWARAQDGPPEQSDEAREAGDTSRLRNRLARILAQLESSAEKVRGAIDRLDEGATAEEAIEELGGPAMVRRFVEAWERWNAVRDEDPGPQERRDRPDAGRRDGSSDAPPTATPEEVMGFLDEHAPRLAERLRAVQEENPRGAGAYLGRLTPRVGEILAAREHDTALGDILTREFQVWMRLLEAAGQYARARREGDGAGAEAARATLRELAAEQVDLRLARRKHEVTQLAERLETLSRDIERQEADREAMIDQLVERTTSERWRDDPSEERRRRRGDRD